MEIAVKWEKPKRYPQIFRQTLTVDLQSLGNKQKASSAVQFSFSSFTINFPLNKLVPDIQAINPKDSNNKKE